MTIIQITDLHINIPNSNSFGVDCQNSFQKTLNASVKRYQPDLVVISGDLCQKDPETNVYYYVQGLLNECNVPFHVISGNHDDPGTMTNIFYNREEESDELYYTENLMDQKFIFLDTTRGSMSEMQYEWFTEEIKTQGEGVYVFMHHPPSFGSAIHMDENYSFKEKEKFTALIKNFSDKKFFIFTGHYHNERTIIEDNMTMFITPSTYVQINDVKREMSVDHSKPAYRVIKIDNKKLVTFVNYLDL